MEYSFISKPTFDNIINNYINTLSNNHQEKALINLNLLEQIKKILLDPSNVLIDDKNTQEWAKKCFLLEEIVLGEYGVMVKKEDKPVLMIEKMYEGLCKTHA